MSNCLQVVAQEYIPGTSYFSENDHIEYIAGNLPIIISAPHGGDLEPVNIPNRNCNGCVYVKDSYTEELSRELLTAIQEATGCYPHVIINRLHRRKLDANRNLGEATDGDPTAKIAWEAFHAFIDTARQSVLAQFEKGLYIDLHGHGHDIQRLELGYLLSRSELALPASQLNAGDLADESSIKHLVSNNLNNVSFSDLIQGNESLGEILHDKGYPSVPSQSDPAPFGSDPYFSGGYNTQRYGSHKGGSIDAIQIECNQDVRFQESTRQRFADSLALALIEYVEMHYFEGFSSCNTVSIQDDLEAQVRIFPNPVRDFLAIESTLGPFHLRIQNLLGQELLSQKITSPATQLDLSKLSCGSFFVELSRDDRVFLRKKMLKVCP